MESSEDTDGPETGRLFRSLRAEGATANDALPALSLDEIVGLRSVTLRREPLPGRAEESPDAPTALDLPVATLPPPVGEPLPAPGSDVASAVASDVAPAPSGRRIRRRPGVAWWGVGLIVVLPTVAAAFAEALVLGTVGWFTGVVLVVASTIGAVTVSRADDVVAVFAPPIALLIATVTAGQFTAPAVGNVWLGQALLITDVLGRGAPLLFAATGIALVIILVRRRRP